MLDGGTAILVNRGFIVLGADRSILPDTAVQDQAGEQLAASRVKITGLLDLVPLQSIRLSDYKHDSDSWPIVLQHVDLEEIMSITGTQFYDMILWLDEGSIGAKKYDMPVLNLNSAKNTGYAFQWFAMSTALVVIYLVVNTRRQ